MLAQIILALLIAVFAGSIFRTIGRTIAARATGIPIKQVNIGASFPPYWLLRIKKRASYGSSSYRAISPHIRISPWIWHISVQTSGAKSIWDYFVIMLSGPAYQFAFTLLVAQLFFGLETTYEVATTMIKSAWKLVDIFLLSRMFAFLPSDISLSQASEAIDKLGSPSLLQIAVMLDQGGFWIKVLLTGVFVNIWMSLWSLLPIPGFTGGHLLQESLLSLFDRLSKQRQEQILGILNKTTDKLFPGIPWPCSCGGKCKLTIRIPTTAFPGDWLESFDFLVIDEACPNGPPPGSVLVEKHEGFSFYRKPSVRERRPLNRLEEWVDKTIGKWFGKR